MTGCAQRDTLRMGSSRSWSVVIDRVPDRPRPIPFEKEMR
jgi:hypothetical protein